MGDREWIDMLFEVNALPYDPEAQKKAAKEWVTGLSAVERERIAPMRWSLFWPVAEYMEPEERDGD